MPKNSEKEDITASTPVKSPDELNKTTSISIPVNDKNENRAEINQVDITAKDTINNPTNQTTSQSSAGQLPASQSIISQLPVNQEIAGQPINQQTTVKPVAPLTDIQQSVNEPNSQQDVSQISTDQSTTSQPLDNQPPANTLAEKPIDQVSVNQPEHPRNEALYSKIVQKKELVQRLNEELYHLRQGNSELVEKEKGTQERMLLRKKDQQQLLSNYNEHVRSRRATEDDTTTIRTKLQELKAMIKNISMKLTSQCDSKIATKAISSFWINLNDAIAKLGTPIPKKRLCMLTEKFLMDVLVQSMNFNTFPGLKISQPYTQLQIWFDKYDPEFCTRLRQEVAKTVVVGSDTAPDIHAETSKFSKRMYNSLYSSLLKAYPFMEKYDAQEQDTSKNYSSLIQGMVKQAISIGYAIRGQEVEIAAAAVGEGTEPLDLNTMNDEDGQSTGIIQFCVCPPFVIYGPRIEILEKARVLCSPLKKS